MVIYMGLIIEILTMNLSTANLNTGEARHLHRFDNCDFNNDFLIVRKWGLLT